MSGLKDEQPALYSGVSDVLENQFFMVDEEVDNLIKKLKEAGIEFCWEGSY